MSDHVNRTEGLWHMHVLLLCKCLSYVGNGH